jgi:predicted O-methyltransferase YrrM
MVPTALWPGVSDSLLAPSEIAAARILTHDHPLKALLSQSDLANAAAVTPITIIEIWRLLTSTGPRAILELGCGVSTSIFAYYARQCERAGMAPPKVFSIEHSPEWIAIVTRRLADQQLASYVAVIEAPLTGVDSGSVHTQCYDAHAIAGRIPKESIDFCLIDGPPAIDNPLNRLGCLPLVSHYLAEDSTVLLDNTAREGEREVIARWRQTYPGQLRRIYGGFSSSGFASFIWTIPRRSR